MVVGNDMPLIGNQIARAVSGKQVELAVLLEEGEQLLWRRHNPHIAFVADFREHLLVDHLCGHLRRQRYAYPQAVNRFGGFEHIGLVGLRRGGGGEKQGQ